MMKFVKCFLVLIGVYFGLTSCMTPITDRATIDNLTTCRHGSLDKIKKNLMLMGYVIVSADDQSLTTDYMQNTGGSYDKRFNRITVVKMGPKLIKFKVREKRIYKSQESDSTYVNANSVNTYNDAGVAGVYGAANVNGSRARAGAVGAYSTGGVSRGHGDASITSYRTVTDKDEYDPTYYQEKIASYEDFRNQVCGGR